ADARRGAVGCGGCAGDLPPAGAAPGTVSNELRSVALAAIPDRGPAARGLADPGDGDAAGRLAVTVAVSTRGRSGALRRAVEALRGHDFRAVPTRRADDARAHHERRERSGGILAATRQDARCDCRVRGGGRDRLRAVRGPPADAHFRGEVCG